MEPSTKPFTLTIRRCGSTSSTALMANTMCSCSMLDQTSSISTF